MDVLAWGVCDDSSVLWGILKTTTLDTVEVWTLWSVNYIIRKRLHEKNPLWGLIRGFPGGPILLEFWKLCYFNKDSDDGKKKKKKIFFWFLSPPPSPMAFSVQFSLLSTGIKGLLPFAVWAWLTDWVSPEGLSNPCLSALSWVILCPHPKINSSPNSFCLCLWPC